MTTRAIVFPIGDDRYAVAATAVREIVANQRTTRLPTAPAACVGAFNLRGEVVPMFDPAVLLGIGKLAETPVVVVVVVVNTALGPAGLVVSGLPKVVALEHEVGPSELRATLGMYSVDDGIAVLIDIDALLLPQIDFGAAALADSPVAR